MYCFLKINIPIINLFMYMVIKKMLCNNILFIYYVIFLKNVVYKAALIL